MFAAMLFSISILALTQFAVFYGRALMAGVAAQPISDRVLEAVTLDNCALSGEDFPRLVGLHGLTADLDPRSSGLRAVRMYHGTIEFLRRQLGAQLPSFNSWSDRELAVCARYAAVQIDRRLQANLHLAASLRSC